MKLKYSLLFLFIFSIGLISASPICIDHTSPESVNLSYDGDMNNLSIFWNESVDLPACSGIDYYSIYKNGEFLFNITETNFTDSLDYGTTTYTIFAVDLAMHSSGESILVLEYIEDGGSSVSRSGGGSSSTVWECGDWGECSNESRSRECVGKYNYLLNKNESQYCVPEFTPAKSSDRTNLDNETLFSEVKTEEKTPSTFNRITGQAVANAGEFATSTTGAVLIGFILILGLGLIILRRKRRK